MCHQAAGHTRQSATASSGGASWACSDVSSSNWPEAGRCRRTHDRRDPSEGPPDSGQPAQKGALPRHIGRTKGGLNSKLHAVCDGEDRPAACSSRQARSATTRVPQPFWEPCLPPRCCWPTRAMAGFSIPVENSLIVSFCTTTGVIGVAESLFPKKVPLLGGNLIEAKRLRKIQFDTVANHMSGAHSGLSIRVT